MPLSEIEQLRQLLADDQDAPEDREFSDDELEGFLDDGERDLERAAYAGWRILAARYSKLVDVTDGNASRKMSQLADNANAMVKLYAKASSGPTEGRARMGKIRHRSP